VRRAMKSAFIANVVVIIALASIARAQTYGPLKNCKLLKARPAILESGDAIRRAINKIIPQVLGDQQNEEGKVIVTVAVDADGSTRCVAAKNEYPLLTRDSIEAAKDWKFDPYIVEGHPVPFVARLTFYFTQQKVWVE
jgi:outer membrane biosynthesis protein TonB